MDPFQALNNLHQFAEANQCNGQTRDALRQSAKAVNDALNELAKFKAGPKPGDTVVDAPSAPAAG